jgi:hypothetical protein
MSLVKEVANSIYQAYINYDTGVPFGIDEARAAITTIADWLERSDNNITDTDYLIFMLREEAKAAI